MYRAPPGKSLTANRIEFTTTFKRFELTSVLEKRTKDKSDLRLQWYATYTTSHRSQIVLIQHDGLPGLQRLLTASHTAKAASPALGPHDGISLPRITCTKCAICKSNGTASSCTLSRSIVMGSVQLSRCWPS